MRLATETILEKLDGKDYHLWKFQMRMIFTESGLIKTIQPKVGYEIDDQKKQNLALAKITLALSKN